MRTGSSKESDLNAFLGYFYVHNTYPTLDLPLLQPIRDIPYAGPPIADIFQPDLRVLVDLGYADYGPGANYANVPTPAGLFEVWNPFTVFPDLALGAMQGPYGAAVEIGVEAGLLSPS